MEVLTVSIWFCVVTVYPWTVKTGKFLNVMWWWRIKPHPTKQNTFTYRPSKFWSKNARQFSYTGELDNLGRPHGLGKWEDSSPHGEFFLVICFVGVRVAFVDSRKESDWTSTKYVPENGRKLRWGVASVECSVSGVFFKNLPNATIIEGPDENKDDAWCIKQTRMIWNR
ncbi:hypothetical protein TrLO_g11640 [Triparma laevis f. longispina]|uniref:Uncharacterized protein n=1 Tax=Triparma laevis f. longispina TaxID=1714387 RepID=A0A9W7CGZ4_9STRA|nr:hypothetical protein TrLO_g11640 [Triparma laevis f. longispina]